MKQLLRSITYCAPILFLHTIFFCGNATGQSISGVVNQYAKVTYITVPSSNPPKIVVVNNVFAANDKVMVIQMKGATIDTSNSASFGTIGALNSAGLYEFGVVNYVSGDTVTLKGPICNNYSVSDSVQLIKVAVYTSPVTVSGTLTCAPWANGIGGVLVIDASDSITLNADIDVSFKGFLGGNVFGVGFNCGASDYCVPNTGLTSSDGLKGEGIAQYVLGKECGRAASANGGGGAGAGNSGAGAGSNYGLGGNGGAQWSSCSSQPINATYYCHGGYNLPGTANRLFLGGGGGGPQHDNGYTVFNGGNGGGIILINAKSISGHGHVIRSDGDSVAQTHDEGTSGAGAGGTIYLECASYTSNVTIEAKGGIGGSVYNTLYPTLCHSPSGGGGGGLVWFSTATQPAAATVDVSGGAAGLILNPMSSCYNTTDYATDGGTGGNLYNMPNPFFYPVQYLHDTIACTDFTMNLDFDNGYKSYLWSTGDSTPDITVTQHGIYTMKAVTNLGCTVHDTAVVKQDSLSLGKDTIICNNTTLTLIPKPVGNFTAYQWQDGSTGPTYAVTNTGEYKVTVNTVLGCLLTDSVHVQVLVKPLLMDTIVCDNRTPASISLPGGYTSYLWSTGGIDSSITVTHSGTYTVHAVTPYGCIIDDTAYVGNDTVNIGKDTTLCFGTTLILKPVTASDFTSYQWQDFSNTPTYTVAQPGLYYVFVKTIHNCHLSDTVNIQYYPQIYSHITGDSAACPEQTIVLSSLETFAAYDWSNGDTSQSINAAAGTYVLRVTTNEGCIGYDTAVVGIYPTPMPYIGPDTAICFDLLDTLNLYPGAFKNYRWQDSSYASHYTVTRPGDYSVTVTDSNKCSATVKREVSNLGCPDPFFVPTGFTPNGDNLNDVFRIKALNVHGLQSFELSVFDRWGELVFHTFNVNAGWDGTYKHKPCEMGDYFWTIGFTMLNSTSLQPGSIRLKGSVTLVR